MTGQIERSKGGARIQISSLSAMTSSSREVSDSKSESSKQASDKAWSALNHRIHELSSNKSKQPNPPDESFESFYLKQITAEFADDIDKIRNAPDFNENSVGILTEALKRTGSNFAGEEKRIIMGEKSSN